MPVLLMLSKAYHTGNIYLALDRFIYKDYLIPIFFHFVLYKEFTSWSGVKVQVVEKIKKSNITK